jgi:hypothetical protein
MPAHTLYKQSAMNPSKSQMHSHMRDLLPEVHLIGATGCRLLLQHPRTVHLVNEKLTSQSGTGCLQEMPLLPLARSRPSLP